METYRTDVAEKSAIVTKQQPATGCLQAAKLIVDEIAKGLMC
jgi:hypothetical protein